MTNLLVPGSFADRPATSKAFSARQRKTSSMPERLLLSSLNCQPPRFKNTALYSNFCIHAPNTSSGSMPRLRYIGSLTSMRSKGRNRRIVSAAPARNLSSCPSMSSLMKSSRWISGLPNISSSRRLTLLRRRERVGRWSRWRLPHFQSRRRLPAAAPRSP
jgi:hypothetical protein